MNNNTNTTTTTITTNNTITSITYYPFSTPLINVSLSDTCQSIVNKGKDKIMNVSTPINGLNNYTNRIVKNNSIKIPDGVKKDLIRNIPITLLNKLGSKEEAIELCLLFLSQFTGTIIAYLNDDDYSITLNYKIMIDNYGEHNLKHILKILQYGKLPILNKSCYSVNKFSRKYYLNKKYLKGIKSYKLIYTKSILIREMILTKALSRAMDNVIGRSVLRAYMGITLPTRTNLMKVGKKLVKAKKIYKGKQFKFKGKKAKKTPKGIRYIENDIDLFEFLTQPSMLIPTASVKAGGRVAHSLNLIPRWIRHEILFYQNRMIEIDYSALHPNIVSWCYGDGRSINHEEIAYEIKSTKTKIKKEHLAYFNEKTTSMTHYSVDKYYSEHYPTMRNNLMYDKNTNGRAEVTKYLFETEVGIMTEVIKQLSTEGIEVLYVYDALYTTPAWSKRVYEVMQEVVDKYKIPTTANITKL